MQMPVLTKSRATARKRSQVWLRWLGRTLMSAGLICLAYVGLVSVQARLYDTNAKQYVSRPPSQDQNRGSSPQPELRPPASALIEGQILGHLKISRLGVSAAVLQGTTSRTLRHGIGHIQGTAFPGTAGNSAIAGHRDTFFRALKDVHEGDEIELKTATVSTRYLVDWAKVVPPEDDSVLDSTRESALTLVTCYPFYFIGGAPQRFVVRAHRIPTAALDPTQPGSSLRGSGPATLLPGEMQ
jgi:sortase A